MKAIKFFIVIFLFGATAGATDYHPSFLSMGGANSYNSERIADSSALWYATHYDLIIPVGGDAASWHIADTLKGCNGSLKLGY